MTLIHPPDPRELAGKRALVTGGSEGIGRAIVQRLSDRAGNAHVRRMMVQLAWGWLRWHSDSALARWYQRRFATGGSRQRRIGIVALARKLLIALWQYVDHGIVPEGARLKVTLA